MKCHGASHSVHMLTSLLCAAVVASLLTSARAQQIVPPFRQDLVGRATTGTATFTVAGRTARPPIEEATFVLRADTEECAPRPFRPCQFTVELLNIRIGSFKIESIVVHAVHIRNRGPISIMIPGPGIPVRTPFDFGLEVRARQDNFVLTTFESRDASIGATPEGGGTIVLNATLVGAVAGQSLTATLNITAAPLVNRPPIARASSHQVLDPPLGETTCAATVILDAAATTDPDGNLSSLQWFDGDGTFVGEGPTIDVPVRKSGVLLFRLIAEDDLGGAATAETTVEVTSPLEPIAGAICEIQEGLPPGAPLIRASFGYNNPNALALTIPVGECNQFTGQGIPEDVGQPELFQPGQHSGVVRVIFGGVTGRGVPAWTLAGTTVEPSIPDPLKLPPCRPLLGQ